MGRQKSRRIIGAKAALAGVLVSFACGSTTPAGLSADAQLYGGTIQVAPPPGAATLPLAKIDEIKQVAGVKTAFATYRFDAKTGQVQRAGVALTESIVAADPTEAAWSRLKTDYAQGHAIDADSMGEVVLGSAIASELSKKIGDTVQLPLQPTGGQTHAFKVVGILDATQSAPDRSAYVNITDGQTLLKDVWAAGQSAGADVTTVATAIDVYARPGASMSELDQIASQINKQVAGVDAIKPSQLVDSLKS
ncbi:MAG TPA: ABC transporter permease [Candidatus Dormibacteraeota bacterium]